MTFARGWRTLCVASSSSFCLFFASTASAQEAADVHSEALILKAPEEEQTVFKLAAGATGNGGNTRAISGNAGTSLELRRSPHMFTFDVLATLGYAKTVTIMEDAGGSRVGQTEDLEQTAFNVVARARYDYFLTRDDALFVALAPRHDPFAGIDGRLQWQAGYLRNLFFPSDDHRLWTELGVDITQDWYDVPRDVEDPMIEPTPDDTFYSARAFLGYTNRLSVYAELNMGAEALFDVKDGKNVRVNGFVDLNTTLTDRFKLGVGFRMLYDNVPVEGARKADTISTLQAVYSFDSLAGKEEPPACPPCEGAAPEAEAAGAAASDEAAPLGPETAAEEAAPRAAEPPEGASGASARR